MTRIGRIVGALAAVLLAVYAGWVLLVDPSYDEMAEDAIRGPDGKLLDPEDAAEIRRDQFRRYAQAQRTPAGMPGDDLVDEEDPGPPPQVGPVDPATARQGFEHIMKRVEALGRARRRLSQAQWRDTYRAANDAFSALSAHLDASDPEQLNELEEAHARLREGLRKVRVRGKKLDYEAH